MPKAIKFAVSVTEEEFGEIEALRREKGISRSKLISNALKLLIKRRKTERLIKLYEEGYRKIPEKPLEIKAWEKVSLESFSNGEW